MSRPTAFTLEQSAREAILLPALRELVEYHRSNCTEYRRILDALGHQSHRKYHHVSDLPWLPVGLFKHHTIRSIAEQDVFRVLTSSGTTGVKSRIHLDREAAATQQRALVATLRTVAGSRRLPMLVVDTKALLRERGPVSARAAGVLGMMSIGRDHTFVLDERNQPDGGAVESFLRTYGHQPFLIFGFTFMVWIHLFELAVGRRFDLANGILIHSGGWKKLSDLAVDNSEFRRRFGAETGLRRIHNFYGMVEQMGTLFLEGPSGGYLYCPDFADVLIRDPSTWQVAPVGSPGVVEVVSTLPLSYPGHAVLTEDVGVVHGVDDGDWPGKRFTVTGRVPRTGSRGCADTEGVVPDAAATKVPRAGRDRADAGG
ncbi:hypothetical protein OG474_41295 [Kribbella sp. NBC_01505]|uniref:LuxE/PaaK family acyltransferase n=1 Tax=Kribbella sp. NBC_01505 TaxID=2903580 RepID=UPI003864A0C5